MNNTPPRRINLREHDLMRHILGIFFFSLLFFLNKNCETKYHGQFAWIDRFYFYLPPVSECIQL